MPRAKVLVAFVVLAALLAGSVLAGYLAPKLSNDSASVPTQAQAVVREPAPRRVVERPRHRRRSLEREVLIVAGSAGAGAAIGAAAHGGKGAAVGALAGGIAGLAYDLATRNR